MTALFAFEVHTPHRLFFSEPVEAITLTLIDGEVGIYAHHSPFTAPVSTCLLRIKDKDGNWKTAFTAEGILEVKKTKTILISDGAQWPEEIDYEQAMEMKENAEFILAGAIHKFEIETATSFLKRAEFQMKAVEEGKEKSEK